jgi:ABC-type polysaccharide/polyol phosphate transport system ATPase subunit
MRSEIQLDAVSVRFRMSYHQARSSQQWLREMFKRVANRWKPTIFHALSNISLCIREGEVVGVIGRNGCGKTTLLRTIAGIYQPDTGKLSVNGRVSALLSLGTAFNTALSGRENITLGGLTLGLRLREIERKAPQIIAFAELGEFIDVPMRYYSSGMMSRLSFALVIAIEPDILLIDETLSVGDISFQNRSRSAMHALLEQASLQMIVSHDLNTIRKVCTRVIWIESGCVAMDGSPTEVVDRYESCGGLVAGKPSVAEQVLALTD